MAPTALTNLKEITDAIAHSETAEEKIVALSRAFELFSQETLRLESAYSSLKERFHSVNLQLEATNHELNTKVGELDITTNYLNSILNNMSQGILFVDLAGNVTTYNRAAEKMLGRAAANTLFHDFTTCFGDDFFGFSMQETLASGTAPQVTFTTLTAADEAKCELEIWTTFVKRGPECSQGLIVLIRDITEIRRLQMIANRTDRMKELGEMAAAVAHEIRNPLGGIKGFAALLQRDLEESPKLQQLASYIVEGSETLDRLVSSVLNYARPIHMQFELYDLLEVVRSVTQIVEADSNLGKNIQVQMESTCPSAIAPIDRQMLKSALLNLFVNSIQAMPDGGIITVTANQDEGHAIMQVTDTGAGIPEEDLENIFSPFFTTKQDGNGFGLAEVYKIIQAHGGSVDVSSTLGEGTTFTIAIPTDQRSPTKE